MLDIQHILRKLPHRYPFILVDRVLETLRPGGLFFLGTAEGRVPCKTPLTTVQPGAFRKAAA